MTDLPFTKNTPVAMMACMTRERHFSTVIVKVYEHAWEAQLAVLALEEEGIAATFEGDRNIDTVDAVRLWVAAAEAERAAAVLDSVGYTVQDVIGRGETVRCLDCDGDDLELAPLAGNAFLRFLQRISAAPDWKRLRCRSCGYEFKRRLY